MAAPESTTPDGPSPSAGPGGASAEPVSDPVVKERDRLLDFLHWHRLNLKLIMDVVYVSVTALQHQGADSDVEVAHVLQRHAGDKLCVEIEKVDKLLKPFGTRPRASRNA